MKKSVANVIIFLLVAACIGAGVMLYLRNKNNTSDTGGISIIGSDRTMDVGKSTILTVSITDATLEEADVTWTSSNPSVATVDSEGVVKAVGAGETTITAKLKDKEASVKITVGDASETVPVPTDSGDGASIENLSISTTNLTISKGSTQTFVISLVNAVGRVDLTSTDTSVATIDNNVLWLESDSSSPDSKTITVTGVETGTTQITINLKDVATFDTVKEITGSLTINVTVQ